MTVRFPSSCCVAISLWLLLPSVRSADVTATEPAVSLPPFMVDGKDLNRPWRYTQSPEFEILSRVPDFTTQELAQSYHRLHRVLAVVLPERFQVRYDVPKTLILYDQSLLPSTTASIFADVLPPRSPPIIGLPFKQQYTMVRNPRLCDLDVMTVFASVPPAAFRPDTETPATFWTSLTASYVEDLLTKRTPPLPTWFVSGFTGLYRRMHFSGNTIELGAVFWRSESETRALRKNGAIPTLLPLQEFFAGLDGRGEKADLWFAQAELLVRWALDDKKGERRAAFWEFLDRSCTEPPSEKLFQEYFGTNYTQGETMLQDYLRTAVFKKVTWEAGETPRLPSLPIRDASTSEIPRIKGDWERLAAHYVTSRSPLFSQLYLDQARRTLWRGYERGERDPALLAVLGLCECDADNSSAARGYLESAMAGGVIRPRAYLELARLRLAEHGKKLRDPAEKLSAAQTADVLEPLLVARRQAPPLSAVYELIAEVWANSVVPPARSDLAMLDEGIRFFPRDSELILRSARVYLAQGFSTEAAQLVEMGLKVAPNDATRERFMKLKTAASLHAP